MASKSGCINEADAEFRAKYYVEHPPYITYRRWTVPEHGELWSININRSSPELVEHWEVFNETTYQATHVVKNSLRFLQPGKVAIDWCTQWGTSSSMLGYVADQVIAIETVEEAYNVAAKNICNMADPPGDLQLQMIPCNTLTLASGVGLVDWADADIIRIGSKSASIILQQISHQLYAHTVVTEYVDVTLNNLMTNLGYTLEQKQTPFKIWRRV